MSINLDTNIRTYVCDVDSLVPDVGVAALFDDVQVALFRLDSGEVFAVQNLCPFSGAAVISRGITGCRSGEPTVASPVYKQVFSLRTGRCLADLDRQPHRGLSADLATYPVHIEAGAVFVGLGSPD